MDDLTTSVFLTVPTPNGNVTSAIGSVSVPIDRGHVDEAALRLRLGGLLQAAGAYLLAGGILTQSPSPGVGESGSPR